VGRGECRVIAQSSFSEDLKFKHSFSFIGAEIAFLVKRHFVYVCYRTSSPSAPNDKSAEV